MSKKYSHTIALGNIDKPIEVIAELKKLNGLLPGSELHQISFFNRAYLIVTEKIHEANVAGLFTQGELMDKLEVVFAKRYFEALNHYVKTGIFPGAWHRFDIKPKIYKRPVSLCLLIGAGAHINYDLPVSLKKAITKPKSFEDDYFKANRLFLESMRDISASYHEPQEQINFIRKNLRFIYLKPITWLVIRWRTKAWYKYINS